VLHHLSAPQQHALTGHSFFPHLISAPFQSGLREALVFAIIACLIAAIASWSRGGFEADTTPLPPSGGDGHTSRTRRAARSRATVAR
jgi:hypothetical protein